MDGTVIVCTSGITDVPEILSREGFRKYSHNFYTFYLHTCMHTHTHTVHQTFQKVCWKQYLLSVLTSQTLSRIYFWRGVFSSIPLKKICLLSNCPDESYYKTLKHNRHCCNVGCLNHKTNKLKKRWLPTFRSKNQNTWKVQNEFLLMGHKNVLIFCQNKGFARKKRPVPR